MKYQTLLVGMGIELETSYEISNSIGWDGDRMGNIISRAQNYKGLSLKIFQGIVTLNNIQHFFYSNIMLSDETHKK